MEGSSSRCLQTSSGPADDGLRGRDKLQTGARALRIPGIRILTMDGLIEDIKRRRYYEKPCRRRQRESYETCRRIYNMEMARKINFLMRKNRADPWQGC
ncbi:hypothetical protein E2I00_010476 [Balaenoptera physalus]|uniref:Mitochondrial ribosomal protein S21 n=1 Tax=Balaenoptera physalus TaxID=9770 RepID=A0A643C5Q1_BALPH|nr:hypothetical protein E2I00_010476 [Balaenoptera physalus]